MLAAFVLTTPLAAQFVQDQPPGRWLIRPMVIGLIMDGDVDELGVDVEDAITAGVDITYFLTENVGFSVLAAFTSPEIEADDGTSLGSLDVLPPTFTGQYHFLPRGRVRPYVGAGLAYMNFFNETGVLEEIDTDVDDGVGVVGQGGVNFMFTNGLSGIVDFRWISILNDPDVETGLGDGELDLNTAVISVGLGFHL